MSALDVYLHEDRAGARERLENPWRQDLILDVIDEIVEHFADTLHKAAAEPA